MVYIGKSRELFWGGAKQDWGITEALVLSAISRQNNYLCVHREQELLSSLADIDEDAAKILNN